MLARTALSSLALLVTVALAGCERPDYAAADEARAGSGGVASGTLAGLGGASASGTSGLIIGLGGTSVLQPPCQLVESEAPVFEGRGVSNVTPARRELFSWTTAEQAAEIRAGGVLMTRTEREGLGPGYAMEVLAKLAVGTPPTDPVWAAEWELAKLLTGPQFEKARYAWSEAWATRVGWPGEDYGDQLLRMVLREDAWLAVYSWGQLKVVDMNNQDVLVTDAAAHPERLAGVFFVVTGSDGGPSCGGSFRSGGEGYREFIIGNESMIEEWSLGTSEIRARIEADAELVRGFFERVRPCPPSRDAHLWNHDVCCSWDSDPYHGELGAYEAALAIPSANYLPQAAPLAALLKALDDSLFEPDPFVVKPARPEP
ncbi:MAG TPA: hypothetical protein VHP33_21600 [Polyangiaceae bacterium]|nr:hypothetical protein [Polyangiaceae bacterium]